ncbi:MAG: PepSY-associated helix [Caulobacteraceae bacterium]|nr:PepSY-associated helix [Caulobacteraceae bacterium]
MDASSRPWTKQAVRIGLRWLYFIHRWLGVAACLFFAMWFFSGLVMMYVPYPAYSRAERQEHAPAIAWDKVAVGPQAALAAAGVDRFPEDLRLEMAGLEPVWRIDTGEKRLAISAADGSEAGDVAQWRAAQIAQAYDLSAHPTLIRLIERDQWTVAGGYNLARPMYLYDLHDGEGGRLYVSKTLGEVVLRTTGKERFWNWLGSVPHWLYPTVLRQDQPAWRQVVMWTSGVAAISAFTGLWIGILRVRLKRKPHQAISPYRGWMKWHHWAGLLGGIFLTTWIVSGWWSVNPFRWFDTPSPPAAGMAAYAGHTAPEAPGDMAEIARSAAGARQARFYWLDGRPLVALDGDAKVLDAASGAARPLTDAQVFAAAAKILPAEVASAERQTKDDDYWYSHHEKHPLPILKLAFRDADRTWIYLHPATGEVLDISNASSRAYRWVFAGLHQLDFRFLIHHRPAWDLALWLLGLGGVVTSISGIVVGWRRLTRKKLQTLRPHAVRS